MPQIQLSWQPGYSLSRKPAKRPTPRRANKGPSRETGRPQHFEFIFEHPMGDPAEELVSSVNAIANSGNAGNSGELEDDSHGGLKSNSERPLPPANQPSNGQIILAEDHGTYSPFKLAEPTASFAETPNQARSDIMVRRADEWQSFEATEASSSGTLLQGFWAADSCPGASNMRSTPTATIPSVLYNSLTHRYKPVLDRYNREFCKIPLTSDLAVNPFQYHIHLNSEPIFLVHAVMALAGHHVQSKSAQSHRYMAVQALRENLDSYSNIRDAYSMLDAIIVLFSLDETQSAFGNWSTHLMGAYSLLEACGGIKVWTMSTRAVVQVGMLTWWDAITSLVSQEECVFPYAYFEAISSKYPDCKWSYFGLCGCPFELVQIVMRLARISAEKRKSASMQFVTFDVSIISEIEQRLELWHHVSSGLVQSEESMQLDQDCMHCSEAWRNGLLLYIYRAFHWQPGTSATMCILRRARVIIDHVLACRDGSMICRQALLPLFFAGCELRDQLLRRNIISLCSSWNERTRYGVFGSAIPLLEEVWAEQEKKGFEHVWWGQVIDKQHMTQSHMPLRMRLCFG